MKFRSKRYFKIPGGEIQYGVDSHCITIWWFGHCLHLWRGSVICWFTRHEKTTNNKVCWRCRNLD